MVLPELTECCSLWFSAADQRWYCPNVGQCMVRATSHERRGVPGEVHKRQIRLLSGSATRDRCEPGYLIRWTAAPDPAAENGDRACDDQRCASSRCGAHYCAHRSGPELCRIVSDRVRYRPQQRRANPCRFALRPSLLVVQPVRMSKPNQLKRAASFSCSFSRNSSSSNASGLTESSSCSANTGAAPRLPRSLPNRCSRACSSFTAAPSTA